MALETKLLGLIREELAKGEITQLMLATKLGLTSVELSQWKSGLRLSPDPRNIKDIEILKNISNYFDLPLHEVILLSLPLEEKSYHQISSSFIKGFEKRSAELTNKKVIKPALERLIKNLEASPEFISVLEVALKNYVEKIKNIKWIEK